MNGWVDASTLDQAPYTWIVRCPEHPPADKSGWKPLPSARCPPEVAGCVECGEFLD